jgi:tRNA-specific 2-thiouridylase
LSRAIFPLQDKTKQENRDFLMKKGVNFIEEESQDVCFFGKREKLEDFIKKSSNKTKSGEIMDEEGNFLGWHKGVIYYTEGQRKGLYLGGGGPYYIIKKDITENKIIVSNNPDHPLLKSSKILLSDCNWICKEPEEGKTYLFKSRYQSNYSKGVFVKSKEKGWTVFLEDSQYAAAPGQSLVVYEEDKVIGGGIIKSD